MAPSKRRFLRLYLVILVACLMVCLAVAYWRYQDLKKLAMAEASHWAQSTLGQEVQIEDFSVSPYGTLDLHHLVIRNPRDFSPGELLRVRRLRLDLRIRPLLRGEFSVRSILIQSPEVTLLHSDEGKWNFSDLLEHLLKQKAAPSPKYHIDELRVTSGMVQIVHKAKYRFDQISLNLKTLTPDHGVKTDIRGTFEYFGIPIEMEGMIDLNDPSRKINLSLASKEVSLALFRKYLEPLHINLDPVRLSGAVRLEGDMKKGFRLQTLIETRQAPLSFLKGRNDLRLTLLGTLNPHEDSLSIDKAYLLVHRVPNLAFTGIIKDLRKKPSYRGDIRIDRLDLSELNLTRDLNVRGTLSSAALRVEGHLEKKWPMVSGVAQLRGVAIESPRIALGNISADLQFSSDRETSVGGEVSGTVMKLADGVPESPFDLRASFTVRGTPSEMAVTSSVDLPQIALKWRTGVGLLEDGHVAFTGRIRGEALSGKATAGVKSVKWADEEFQSVTLNSSVEVLREKIVGRNLSLDAQRLKLSADELGVSLPGVPNSTRVLAKGLRLSYPGAEAEIQARELTLTFVGAKEGYSSQFQLSGGEAKVGGLAVKHLSSTGNFDQASFSVEIPQVEILGGKAALGIQGRVSEFPFPLKAMLHGENLDLAALFSLMPASFRPPYAVDGTVQKMAFDGTVESRESLLGRASFDVGGISIRDIGSKHYALKDSSLHSEVELKGKDLVMKGEATQGPLVVRVAGTVNNFFSKDPRVQAKATLSETRLADIRTSLWEVFPDSLLYAGLEGSLSSDMSVDYGTKGLGLNGSVTLRNVVLEGENQEYSLGPVNGVIPLQYQSKGGPTPGDETPVFEKSQFESLDKSYITESREDGTPSLRIASFRYGFPLMEDIRLFIKPVGSAWSVNRFSARMFGGRLAGSAFIDPSRELRYRAGFLLKGLSLQKACDGIEPIKGFVSGKLDGVGALKGTGTRMKDLIGMADFWTYQTRDEKTMISREFLQKVGGPSVKTYLGDRPYDKGIVGFYLKDGFVIFKDLEISNKNFWGITDLSIKVAPLSNRIALDHLLWTVVEAAERAKGKK